MDKKIAGLLGAVAGLATLGTAQAAISPAPIPTQALRASSYADLLAPIANPVELLKADEAARAQQPAPEPAVDFEVASAHHHHHHHQQRRERYSRNYHHHHHHHHHNGAFIGIPGLGGVVLNRR